MLSKKKAERRTQTEREIETEQVVRRIEFNNNYKELQQDGKLKRNK